MGLLLSHGHGECDPRGRQLQPLHLNLSRVPSCCSQAPLPSFFALCVFFYMVQEKLGSGAWECTILATEWMGWN